MASTSSRARVSWCARGYIAASSALAWGTRSFSAQLTSSSLASSAAASVAAAATLPASAERAPAIWA